MEWLEKEYPESFNEIYKPRFEEWRALEKEGKRWYNTSLPCLCQTCQLPMMFTEIDNPTKLRLRESEFEGENYQFCSDGCKDIFDDEPQKYVQANIPVQKILKGEGGGPAPEDVVKWAHFNPDSDTGGYEDSMDAKNWTAWKA